MKKTKLIALFLCFTSLISIFGCTSVSSATEPEWATNVHELPDYDYSFAVLGDTQNLMKYDNYDNYHAMYDWIIENKDTQKIKFVMGLGDITEDDTEKEWENAKQVRQKLCENGILNSFVRGNHDLKEDRFNKYFSYYEFGETVTGTYEDHNMLNTYTKFTVENVKYIVFALTVGPSDEILNWVGNIAEKNPDHNIIITTHVYLTDKGTRTQAPAANHKKYYGTNGGEQMWDKLIKKHENIILVLSGHYAQRAIERTQNRADNGNYVAEMMIDAEQPDEDFKDIGGLGLVAMFYFSENGKKLNVRYYSTVHDKYYMDENQFTVSLDLAGDPVKKQDSSNTNTTPSATTTTPPETEPLNTIVPGKNNTVLTVLIISGVILVLGVATTFIILKKKKK